MKLKNTILTSKFKALALAVLMLTSLLPQSVLANELGNNSETTKIPDNAISHTYEMTIEPDEICSISNSGIAPASYYPAETFTFQGTRRGADHYMDGNYMAYEVTITMADGSTDNFLPVLIKICKYDGSGIVDYPREFHPDGITHKVDWIPVPDGGVVFFSYANASSGTASGPVTLTLTTYSWE